MTLTFYIFGAVILLLAINDMRVIKNQPGEYAEDCKRELPFMLVLAGVCFGLAISGVME